MFCALLTSRYQVSVYRTNGPVVLFYYYYFFKIYILLRGTLFCPRVLNENAKKKHSSIAKGKND